MQDHFLNEEEMKTLNKSLSTLNYESNFENAKIILICRLILFAGLIPSEIIALRYNDMNFSNGKIYITVENRSGGIKRELELPYSQFATILEWYKNKSNAKDDDIVFQSTDEYQMSNDKVNKIVKNAVKNAGIVKAEVNPRLLRKSFAIFLHNNPHPTTRKSVPLKEMQYLLGQGNGQHTKDLLEYGVDTKVHYSDVFEDF